jgi:tetratricopeptide (TPR) repeat protein
LTRERGKSIFQLAFSVSCGMISRFMSADKPLPSETKGAHRQADVYDLLAWLEVNRTKVLVAAVALVAVGFAIATVRYMREEKELNASGQLLALRVSLNQPTNAAPVQASALLKVAKDFSGTSAAERARLLAATAFFTEGKYADAEREFSAFAKEFPNNPWTAAAAYGVASAQEAQNKPEAVTTYQRVGSAYANSYVADDAKLALARIYETRQQPDQALRIYNELLLPRPGAQPGEAAHPEAFARKEALLRKHPELNTNAAPARASTPPPAGTGEKTLQLPAAPGTAAQSGTNSAAPNK